MRDKGKKTEILSSLATLSVNNARYTVLVATEMRRRESRVALPCSRTESRLPDGRESGSKKIAQKPGEGGLGGDAEVCSLLFACLQRPSMAQAGVMGF